MLLRATEKKEESEPYPNPGTGPVPPTIGICRAFSRPSVLFGRWTLSWTMLLAPVLFLLGLFGYLPNQTNRVAFDQPRVECAVDTLDKALQRYHSGGTPRTVVAMEESLLFKWMDWIEDGTRRNAHQECLHVLQREPYSQNYITFPSRIRLNDKYRIVDLVGFLVKGLDYLPVKPVYRQLAFRSVGRDTLLVENPDKGERIFLLMTVAPLSGGTLPADSREYDIRVETVSEATP
jgi:hypothetical protein